MLVRQVLAILENEGFYECATTAKCADVVRFINSQGKSVDFYKNNGEFTA